MMNRFLACVVLVFVAAISYGQKDHLSSKKGETNIGIGLGLPYGGIGIRVGNNIVDNLNLFGSLGYQFAGVGYNFGLLKDFPSAVQTQFYLTGMYGTNSGIVVEGATEYNELFTGVTFGGGVKINSRKTEGNYWDLGLLVPIRSSAYKDKEEELKNNNGITLQSPPPVAIVIGYNF